MITLTVPVDLITAQNRHVETTHALVAHARTGKCRRCAEAGNIVPTTQCAEELRQERDTTARTVAHHPYWTEAREASVHITDACRAVDDACALAREHAALSVQAEKMATDLTVLTMRRRAARDAMHDAIDYGDQAAETRLRGEIGQLTIAANALRQRLDQTRARLAR